MSGAQRSRANYQLIEHSQRAGGAVALLLLQSAAYSSEREEKVREGRANRSSTALRALQSGESSMQGAYQVDKAAIRACCGDRRKALRPWNVFGCRCFLTSLLYKVFDPLQGIY